MINEKLLTSEEKAALTLRALYGKYGYLPYQMSKFEEYELYLRNKDFLVSDRIITFTDTDGRLLALKPDITLSIIKNGEDTPGCKQKVCYDETVYRVSPGSRHFRELPQAGLECIGDIDLYDMYEVIALAAESLSLISDDFVLELSHLGLLSVVLDSVDKDPSFQQQIIDCIEEKNAHDLQRLCRQRGVEKADQRRLLTFINAYGRRDQVLRQLEEEAEAGDLPGFRELKQLSCLLDASPFSDRIRLDFSVVNDRNYYSGIVFKGFVDGICQGVLAGGRYDKLMRKMGRKAGGFGFALYLDLLQQLQGKGREYDVDVLLLYSEGADSASVIKAVERLTAESKTVSVQKNVPPGLRWRELQQLGKEEAGC